MRIDALLAELYTKQAGPFRLNLSRIRKLAAKLGNPEKNLKAIHVAGSNGKGSTCAFLFSVLREAGYRVGLYTSPHLRHFNERIRVDDAFISDGDIVRLYKGMKGMMGGDETFFEITTMMALLYFAEKSVDIAVVEVGLGGRLDATNIVTPLVSAITNISIEHTGFLGDTIGQIAKEKAGIIKKGVPVVTSATGTALSAIKKVAGRKHAPVHAPLPWRKAAQGVSIGQYRNLVLGLKGDHQAGNAAVAVRVISLLQSGSSVAIPGRAVRAGLKNACWPGRLEFVGKSILIDCAHNRAGMDVLEKELRKIRRKKVMVIGILEDKDVGNMMATAGRNARLLILTTPNSGRAVPPEELAQYARKPCLIVPDPQDALREARRLAKKGELIVITGSIYLVGEYVDPLHRRQ
ncbi:bifunctional folylpolyglutamate synthase/dihydrofolate synthase [Candidatus Woesearchaeota archaeon]|nr:bifunctional folylpolyglutamate synthase/dihydrofolate synthase [Candidatus Woesearchaeota archaeon]